MKQQPQHRNLIYETTTKRSKYDAKTREFEKQKGEIRKKGLTKQQPKTSKTCRKVVVCETSPFSIWNKTYLWTKETPMCPCVFGFCFCARSGYCCLKPKPRFLQKNSGFRVFGFCWSCERTMCTIFSQLQFSPKTDTKTGIFQKPQFLQNSGLRPIKTLFVSRNAFFLCFSYLQLVSQFFDLSKKRHPSKKLFLYFFLKHTFYIISQNGLFKKGVFGKLEKEDNKCEKRKPKNTNLDQNSTQNPFLNYFLVRKRPPKRWTN